MQQMLNRYGLALLVLAALAVGAHSSRADEAMQPALSPMLSPSAPNVEGDLPQISVNAPEPRYVAPTRRDRIGRIWAPVLINGQGPYRLAPVMLQGVTGSAEVPTIRVDSLTVGDMTLRPYTLPIVIDALGGADGILGTEGLGDKRIYIDFRHDLIRIMRSHNERADADFQVIPVEMTSQGLLMFTAYVGGVRVKAVLDTGGQVTIGNWAMRDAMLHHQAGEAHAEQVFGVTDDEQNGESYATPPIRFGNIRIQGARVTYGDMRIFDHWKLTREPILLIGMDAIGLLDTVIIDYRRRELQIRMRPGF